MATVTKNRSVITYDIHLSEDEFEMILMSLQIAKPGPIRIQMQNMQKELPTLKEIDVRIQDLWEILDKEGLI